MHHAAAPLNLHPARQPARRGLRARRWLQAAGWATWLATTSTSSWSEPSQVVVVRHAERAAESAGDAAGDPGLSAAGLRRAQQLADLLTGSPGDGSAAPALGRVDAIVATEWQRTLQTAEPTAQRFGITPRTVATRGVGLQAHVDAVVTTVRSLDGVVLVVAHSNTVAAIVAGLSAARLQPLCDTSYSHLFVVKPKTNTVSTQRYGAADPAPAGDCQ